LARAIGAVVFAMVTGVLMAVIFHKDDKARTGGQIYVPENQDPNRTLPQKVISMTNMVLILVFAAFAKPFQALRVCGLPYLLRSGISPSPC